MSNELVVRQLNGSRAVRLEKFQQGHVARVAVLGEEGELIASALVDLPGCREMAAWLNHHFGVN